MTKVNIAPMVDFLEKEVDVESLKSRLDDIAYRYSLLALRDTDACGGQPDEADDIFYLRMIRDVVAATMVPKGE